MPTLDQVYRKFGEVSEAAQLLETDLGTVLLFLGAVEEGLITPALEVDGAGARDLSRRIDRQTLGQLIRNCTRLSAEIAALEPLLANALDERNRLSHSFYREHNLRRNSEAGRAIMLADLESMHVTLLDAWKALNLLLGIDLDALARQVDEKHERRAREGVVGEPTEPPLQHLPLGPRPKR